MHRSTDTMEDSVMERRHCIDHSGQTATLTALDQKIESKFTIMYWILSGVGAAVLGVLLYNQGRIDAQERITAMLQANMITIEKQVAQLQNTHYYNRPDEQ